jgi:hypothetical protein
MAAGETKVSLMTYLGTVPDDVKIYIVKPGDTTPYFTTKAALLSGIDLETVLSNGGTVIIGDNEFYVDVENGVLDWSAVGATSSPALRVNVDEEVILSNNNVATSKQAAVIIDTDGDIKLSQKNEGNTKGTEFSFDAPTHDTYIKVRAKSADGTYYVATEDYVDDEISAAVVGLLDDRGNYDASSNLFPSAGGSGTAGAVLKGDLWTVSVAGTLGGNAVTVGDVIRALVDTPAQTLANWAVTENNLGYVAENSSNKTDTMSGNTTSSIKYLSAKGVYDYIASVLVNASASVRGIAKLYTSTGSNTDGSMDQNSVTNELALKAEKTVAATGSVISFAVPQVYNSPASPSSSNITDDLTSAQIGVVQKIYSNKSTAPTYPAGWVKIGSGSYTTSTLNIIYAEWVSGTRVEYWIVQ